MVARANDYEVSDSLKCVGMKSQAHQITIGTTEIPMFIAVIKHGNEILWQGDEPFDNAPEAAGSANRLLKKGLVNMILSATPPPLIEEGGDADILPLNTDG
jgi:hypothetical protein